VYQSFSSLDSFGPVSANPKRFDNDRAPATLDAVTKKRRRVNRLMENPFLKEGTK
jgi:hypothetical protein